MNRGPVQSTQHPIKLVSMSTTTLAGRITAARVSCYFSAVENKLKILSENQRILYNQQEKILKNLEALQQRASWRGWQ